MNIMENPESQHQDFFLNQIKSKLNQFRHDAVPDLWDNINNTSAEEIGEKKIDEKVRLLHDLKWKAPRELWFKIEKSLYVDEVWERIIPLLDQRYRFHLYRKYAVRIGAVASLFLLVFTCSDFSQWNATKDAKVSEVFVIKKQKFEKKPEQNKLSGLNPNKNKVQEILNQKETKPILLNEINSESHILTKQQTSKGIIGSKINVSAEENQILTENLSTINQKSAKDSNPIEVFPKSALVSYEPGSVDSKRISKITQEVQTFNHSQQIENINKRPEPIVEFGFYVKSNSSLIVNELYSKSISNLSNISLVKPNQQSPMGLGMGVSFLVRPMKRLAVLVDFSFSERIEQEFIFVKNNKSEQHRLSLDYFKSSIGLRYDFFQYQLRESHQKLFIQSGMYLSNLIGKKDYATTSNSRIELPTISNWDSGVYVQLGQSHRLGLFSVDYGVRLEYGVNEVMRSSRNVSKNLITYGLIASLKYRIK